MSAPPPNQNNAGGLAVVWATENTREAIFDAIKRKEVYATSGRRPIVRFFARQISRALCRSTNLARRRVPPRGVPWEAISATCGVARSPSFAVSAEQDPAGRARPCSASRS